MCAHDLSRERKPETATGDLRSVATLDAEELFEDVQLLVIWDAQPSVLDGYARSRSADPGANVNRAARLRLLDRIRQQVRDHLPDARAIAADRQRLRWKVERESVRRRLGRELRHLL